MDNIIENLPCDNRGCKKFGDGGPCFNYNNCKKRLGDQIMLEQEEMERLDIDNDNSITQNPNVDYFENIKEIDRVLEAENININLEKAKARLAENLKKEAESVDPRVMCIKLRKGFVELYGLINGANTSSQEAKCMAEKTEENVRCLENTILCLENRLEVLEVELNYLNLPFYKRWFNKKNKLISNIITNYNLK